MRLESALTVFTVIDYRTSKMLAGVSFQIIDSCNQLIVLRTQLYLEVLYRLCSVNDDSFHTVETGCYLSSQSFRSR